MKQKTFLILILITLVMLVASCNVGDHSVNIVSLSSKGFDNAPSSTMSLNEFTTIDNQTPLSVEYCRSEDHSVIVLGDTSKMEILHVEVGDGTLRLSLEPGVYHDLWLKVLVYAPNISSIHQNGSGNIKSDALINREAPIDVVSSGSGNISIKGIDGKDVHMEVNGSGNIEAKEVLSQTAFLSINGSGSIRLPAIQVEEDLEASINASGSMHLDGSALKVKANVSGSGSITGKLNHQVLESTKNGSGHINLRKE